MSTLLNYIVGFVLSALLTLGAAGLLWWHDVSGHAFPTHQQLAMAFVALALTQLIVQLIFFLHLGKEKRQENVAMFGFALVIVCILMGGTLWIMSNLQSQHIMPQEFKSGVVAPQNQLD